MDRQQQSEQAPMLDGVCGHLTTPNLNKNVHSKGETKDQIGLKSEHWLLLWNRPQAALKLSPITSTSGTLQTTCSQ
eukprot:14491693-Heterocapsa_arctica.AAC.1